MVRQRSGRLFAGLVLFLIAGCGSGPGGEEEASLAPGTKAPFVRVLGTVQDGGLPHAACTCTRCEAARRDPAQRRWIASLAIVLPESQEVYLVDATPDLREQLDALADVRQPPPGRVDRSPVSGVLLTHAHMGHYLGLAFFGFEAVHTRSLPVYCTPRMGAFLRENGPWSQLVGLQNIDLQEVPPGGSFELGEGIRVTLIRAPHRDEYSDTVGFLIAGPRKRLFYLPDTDSWETWEPPIPQILDGVDIALLDGTFFSLDELPGRSVATIGHPLITQTLELLEPRVRSGALEVYFTHLNHSNPALEPGSPARREIETRGFHVLEEGQEFSL